MDKYCTFRKRGSRRTCGPSAVAPHPSMPNQTLCRQHLKLVKKYLTTLFDQL